MLVISQKNFIFAWIYTIELNLKILFKNYEHT